MQILPRLQAIINISDKHPRLPSVLPSYMQPSSLTSDSMADGDHHHVATAAESNMDEKHADVHRGSVATVSNVKPGTADADLVEAIRAEHQLTFVEAVKLYPKAIGWSAFVSMGVIMLAFDPQLIGNLYSTPQFQRDFGHEYKGEVCTHTRKAIYGLV